MSELITTLHPQDDNSVNLYPNVKLENIVDGTAEDAGKFVKVNEEGKFIVETVNIPEPQQVNNSTVTIKQGGVDKGSFTLNQAEDATIELDAGGAGESGSSMYATSSAISKGVPAHKEAANPIKVGDTISQLYFNTQQDITPYLETCVDWNNGGKVTNLGDNILLYPLLTAISDENEAGFRELKAGDYIYGLKIKADYRPGDGKVDPELNAWLANILTSQTSVDLFYVGGSSSSVGLKASKNETGSGTEYTLTCCYIHGDGNPTTFVIYSSLSGEGFKTTSNWDSSKHIYELVAFEDEIRKKELIVTEIRETENAGWNGVFFGAVSDLGELVLSAYKFIGSPDSSPFEDTYILTGNTYANPSLNLSDMIYYSSAPFLDPDDPESGIPIKAGWHVTADQAVALSKPETVTTVNDVISKIASSEANWESVPEVFGSIYQDDILGTDEVKVNDILVDTTGTLGKVKELSEESFKNQHPANPFAVGDEIPANSYVYIDTSITPDLSKIDWSRFDPAGSGGIFPLVPLEFFAFAQLPQSAAPAAMGIKINKPVYLLSINNNSCSYVQVDPSDIDTVLNSPFSELMPNGANKWYFSEQVTHEGSVFKVPLENAEAVTLTDINDQDVWGSFISKDGKWVEDTPISRTRVSCEALRQLPTNYDNLDGIPIIKSDHIITDDYAYQFIPGNYINKYIQDPTGIIYFCDGQQLYQLKGNAASKFTVNLTGQNGLFVSSTGGSDNSSYSATIGLTDKELLNASEGDYSAFCRTAEDDYGWVLLPAKIIKAGTGISTSRDNGGAVDITTISLSQDTQDRLPPSTTGLDPIYKYHLVRSNSSNSHKIVWEKTQSTSIGTGLVEELTTPSEQTLKIGLSSSDLDYTQPNTKVYAKNTDSNTFGWVSLPSQSGTSIQAGSGINVSGNTVSLTSDSINRSISSANSGMYVMARDGSTMSQIGWSSVYIPRGVNPGTGLASSADDSDADTLSLSQDVQDKLARIPDLPSADGNYALTCTISGGVPTFAWTLATN